MAFPEGHSKASLVFFSLTLEQRETIRRYLEFSQWRTIIHTYENSSTMDSRKLESLYTAAARELKALRPSGKPSLFAWGYLFAHILLFILFLPSDISGLRNINFSLEITAFIYVFYALFGSFFIWQKSIAYWKWIFRIPAFYFPSVVHASASFLFLIYLVGSLDLDVHSGRIRLEFFILAFLSGPIFEELLFRDILYRAFFMARSSFLSIVIPSVFFSLVHLSGFHIWEFLVYFLAGIILASLRWQSGGLFFPILVHSTSNLFFLLL